VNPPTLVLCEGRLPLCAEHAAALARAGKRSVVASDGELEGRACISCELEAFRVSDQTVTTWTIEALEDSTDTLRGDREPSFPVDMTKVDRRAPAAFVVTFQDGSRWTVSVTPAYPRAVAG
jgi:hypothetical protein